MLNEEQIKKGFELIAQGCGRTRLKQELKIGEADAKHLMAQARAEEWLKKEPGHFEEAKKLVRNGISIVGLSDRYMLTLVTAEALHAICKERIWNEDLHNESLSNDELIAEEHKQAQARTEQEELVAQIAEYIKDGYSREHVRKILPNIEGFNSYFNQARRLTDSIPLPRSRGEKLEKAENIIQEGRGVFGVAQALKMQPRQASRFLRRGRGESPLDDSIRNELTRGTTLLKLQKFYGINDREHALDIFQSVFPDQLVVEYTNGYGEKAFILAPKSTGYEWLSENQTPKRFKTSFGGHRTTVSKNTGAVAVDPNYMYVQFDKDISEIKLWNLTDVHISHIRFREAEFLSVLKTILDDPNSFVILGGDLADFITKMSVGEPWENEDTPMAQCVKVAKLLMCIKHRLIAYRKGNHENRGKHNHSDFGMVIANFLEVPYFQTEVVIQLQIQDQLFTVILDHGWKGGSLQNIIRDAERFQESMQSQVHAHFSGHCHDSQIIERVNRTIVPGRGIEYHRAYTLISGSFLGYEGTYAEQAKFRPNPQDCLYLSMNADGDYEPGRVRMNGV